MYRNEIHEMDETELVELIDLHSLTVEDINFIDSDEVIELLEHEIGTIFESVEDDILDSIMNGNWTDASKQMHENYITPNGLADYVNDYRYEEFDDAYEFFDLSSAVCITELYHKEVA